MSIIKSLMKIAIQHPALKALELLIKDIEKFESDIKKDKNIIEYSGIVSFKTAKAIKEVFGDKYKIK